MFLLTLLYKKGAVETLITQSKHRKADMLYDPHALIQNIKDIDKNLDIDLYIVDILSYSVTLALYSLDLDFVTFCPPHPYTIPDSQMHYGLPKHWPSKIKVKDSDVDRLKLVSKSTQKEFTEVFNNIIDEKGLVDNIDNAFALVSDIAVVYNYFDFCNQEEKSVPPYSLYIGNSFNEEVLSNKWKEFVQGSEKVILITLGTFLSNRKDVLEKLITFSQNKYPEALIIVSAGSNAKNLKALSSDKVLIEEFIPQIALMPYVDLVIFHGGCNTFTEAMYYGKDLIILPFSSDQFNLAYDVEVNMLGEILDPNNFNEKEMDTAFEKIENNNKDNLKKVESV